MPEWHRLLACLAIYALLIQSIVPELAMAAREAMARQAVATETLQGHGSHSPKEPERTQLTIVITCARSASCRQSRSCRQPPAESSRHPRSFHSTG